jgi:heterodisulfide reductase subunit D
METFNSGLESESLICAHCGYCQAVCPVFDVIGWESSGPRARMAIAHQAAKGQKLSQDQVQRVFQCTLCGRCREVCSTRIDTGAVWLHLRETLTSEGYVDDWPLAVVRNNLEKRQNITGEEAEKRLLWQENLENPPANINLQSGVELVYFVGCVAGLYPQTNVIPTSLTEILIRSGVSFTTMGGKEICCGFPALGMGLPDLAANFARRNLDTIKALRAKALVATCPSCYHTWQYVYPEILGKPTGIEVMHSSQLLTWLMNDGHLKLKPLDERVTYHDPCDLGRNSGVYDPPRQVLRAIPGLELVEMENNRENAICCGGGGNLEVVDAELAQTIASQRIQQAVRTGASILVTPCQQCKRTLTKAVRTNKVRMRVMDLVEIVLQQMR